MKNKKVDQRGNDRILKGKDNMKEEKGATSMKNI